MARDAVTKADAAVPLRAGTAADVDPCVSLWVAAVAARDGRPAPAGTAERARAKFARAHVAFAVASDNPGVGVVGFALVTVPGSAAAEDPPGAAYLAMLAVSSDRQNAGLGAALLDRVTAQAGAADHPELVLHVLASNTKAVRLYQSRGWHSLGAPSPHALTGQPSRTYVQRFSAQFPPRASS
jgi:ribosomal protein S18 acetylase RimI-like enzyme